MTPKQIALVQESWKHVEPIAGVAAELFYARLFALEPSLRALFKGDMSQQGRKLMSMISVAVGSLERLDELVPAVQALGRRHTGYGVEERHYTVVESALVWTLGQGLGARFTKEVEHAWRVAYGVLASRMKQ
jgi:hemoglobin-like flavoprotein